MSTVRSMRKILPVVHKCTEALSPSGLPSSSIQRNNIFVPTQGYRNITCPESPSVAELTSSGRCLNLKKDAVRNSFSDTQTRCFLGFSDGKDNLAKHYEERKVMGYTPEQLFSVVSAVDLYEDFVPWCQSSRILHWNPDGSFDAELQIGFNFFIESYVSHVELEKPRYVKTTASKSGLFDHLINVWEFDPGPIPGTSCLHFLVDFKFKSPLYRQVASMFFSEVVSRLVSSFSDRCRSVYGPGVRVLETEYGGQRVLKGSS